MIEERSQRIRDVFLGAAGRSPMEIEDYLVKECSGDSKLRAEVDRLLAREGRKTEWGGRDERPESPTVTALFDEPDPRPVVGFAGMVAAPDEVDDPATGRYRKIRELGSGGFGQVFLARDTELDRLVAIKVPNPGRVTRSEDFDQFMAEARTLAKLDHPNIVPVHDIVRTPEGPCSIVSRYIEGTDLANRLRTGRLSIFESASLIEAVCEAAHHAHTHDLVHRDIKPSNILIDTSGRPYLADFGLALRDENYGKGSGWAGTPAYMSPEQARGEGHRVDGRSDVFSLGVVLYQLLTGRRPFRGENNAKLMEAITTCEPRPPRQVDDAIPRELERVCLKALAKRASERYTTARDMAEDIRHYLRQAPGYIRKPQEFIGPNSSTLGPTASGRSSLLGRAPSDSVRPLPFVPKGLRSFDEHDADFFLDLLPGPRDRDGLPEALRFWMTRIEATDSDQTFRVGMIYGSSGCGKSSLVKAGLLPRLAGHITSVYVEAAGGETESRLLRSLRRACPALPADLGLVEVMASLRRDRLLGSGRKLLIVLDQFEQWLFARRGDEATELYSALRQCDGENVQAILLVRDDFWMAATRFMRDLDLELMSDRNLAAVDLFDRRHARKILADFGRGYGALPLRSDDRQKEQETFLDEAIEGLARDDRIIPVRLALFAEMIKSKPWSPATFKEVGGAQGVGVTFLEETFASSHANPRHSLHQAAAQAVLKALLPESVADIKGRLRPEADLREVSGYAARPREFQELIHILAGELRLISPADPEGQLGGGSPGDRPSEPSYQLTHDYLIQSIREWIDRKGRAAWRGRAGILLADRATVWDRRRERRHLASWPEYLYLRAGTRRRDRLPLQSAYLRASGRYHAERLALLVAGLIALAAIAWERYGQMRASEIVQRLLRASPIEASTIIDEMAPLRPWVDPMLRAEVNREQGRSDGFSPIGLRLALLPCDPSQATVLRDRLLKAGPEELKVVRMVLVQHREGLSAGRWEDLVEGLWKDLAGAVLSRDETLRAACGLAEFAPSDPRWAAAAPIVVECLLAREPVVAGPWIELLAPVSATLGAELKRGFLENRWTDDRRQVAAVALAEYLGEDLDSLVRLAVESSPEEVAVFIPALRKHPSASALLDAEFVRVPRPEQGHSRRKDPADRRRAAVALALMGLGHAGRALDSLRISPDPTFRSYLIEDFNRCKIDPRSLLEQLDRSDVEPSVRQAIILALGEYDPRDLPAAERSDLIRLLVSLYQEYPDSGVHEAAGWLLARVRPGVAVDPLPRRRDPVEGRDWYINGEGQAFAVIHGPVNFTFAPEVDFDVRPISVKVPRSFALSTLEVTRRLYADVMGAQELDGLDGATNPPNPASPDDPVNFISYYEAVRFCRKLSEKEKIDPTQMCYPPVEEIDENMQLPPNYLERTGYRLPTEAEWVAGCYGRSRTFYPFGRDSDLLPHYARYRNNGEGRVGPVGRLKPNDLGLFDALGNLYEWCERYPAADGVAADGVAADGPFGPFSTELKWVIRGGAYESTSNTLSLVKYRNEHAPTLKDPTVGFRVARTCQ